MKDEFKKLDLVKGEVLPPCPFCGSELELWEIETGSGFLKAVCCSNGVLDEQDDDDECLLYMPARQLQQPTRREAIEKFTKVAIPITVYSASGFFIYVGKNIRDFHHFKQTASIRKKELEACGFGEVSIVDAFTLDT